MKQMETGSVSGVMHIQHLRCMFYPSNGQKLYRFMISELNKNMRKSIPNVLAMGSLGALATLDNSITPIKYSHLFSPKYHKRSKTRVFINRSMAPYIVILHKSMP